jgi:hypothetical protein
MHQGDGNRSPKRKHKEYDKQLRTLPEKLCVMQEWIKATGQRIIIVYEGRDAAGKGGTIKAMNERVSPRVFRLPLTARRRAGPAAPPITASRCHRQPQGPASVPRNLLAHHDSHRHLVAVQHKVS